MPPRMAGCQTCKSRHIKCDGTQPICQRCTSAGRACNGMISGEAWPVIHDENVYASGQKKRPRGPRPVFTADSTGSLETDIVPHPVRQSAPGYSTNAVTFEISNPKIVIAPSLSVDLKEQANTYYVHYHLQGLNEVPNISKGVFDDLLHTWKSKAHCPMLDYAASSMALAVFSQAKQHPLAAVEASKQYHKLLQITQIEIPSLNEENIDICLIAIVLMGRYEDVIHRPSRVQIDTSLATTLQSFSHHDGALATLKLWKHRLSQKLPPTEVITHTRRGLIRSALLRNLAIPAWMQDGSCFGEHGLELEYDRIIIRITILRQRLTAVSENTTVVPLPYLGTSSEAVELDEEARKVDQALQDWASHFPSNWGYTRHTLPDPHPWPIRHFYSRIVYGYSSPAYAAVWGLYYATRMFLNSIRVRIINLDSLNVENFISEQCSPCHLEMNHLALDLASSIPFCLQRFEVTENTDSPSQPKTITLNVREDIKPSMAMLPVWPLTIASSLEGMDESLRSWYRSELSRLGKIVGIGVLESTETKQWLKM